MIYSQSTFIPSISLSVNYLRFPDGKEDDYDIMSC
jgi:hypothetical protein